MRFEQSEIDAFFRHDGDPDVYHDIIGIPFWADGHEALVEILELVAQAPGNDGLSWIAAALLEPLLERHWSTIDRSFERALVADRRRRLVLNGVILDAVPSEVEARWRSAAGLRQV